MKDYMYDHLGRPFGRPVDTSGMMVPARCTHCREVYDVTKVEVTARYTDCSMWTAPCCGAHGGRPWTVLEVAGGHHVHQRRRN